MHQLGRILLLLASFKWRRVTLYHIYYEFILFVIEAMLPYEMPLSRAETLVFLMINVTFWLSYFNFVSSFVTMILSMVPMYVSRYVFFGESAG